MMVLIVFCTLWSIFVLFCLLLRDCRPFPLNAVKAGSSPLCSLLVSGWARGVAASLRPSWPVNSLTPVLSYGLLDLISVWGWAGVSAQAGAWNPSTRRKHRALQFLSLPWQNLDFRGENRSGWVLYPSLCGSFRLCTISPYYDPRSSWQPFVPTKCLHPWQVSSSQASVQKWGAVSLSAHPFYFFLEFSSQGFLLSLPYSYRKVQFLFCLGFSHPNLNQKYPVIGILLQACSSQQYAMDIFPCEHKEVYLIILEL